MSKMVGKETEADFNKRIEEVEKKIEKIEKYIGETMIDTFNEVSELNEEEINDIKKMRGMENQKEKQKKESGRILKNKKPEELANEFKDFIEEFIRKKYPELKKEEFINFFSSSHGWFDNSRIEEFLQLFLQKKYGIDYQYRVEDRELNLDIQIAKDIVTRDYLNRYGIISEKKEVEKLKEEEKLLPSLIEECYEWAKEKGYNSRNFGQPSVRQFLQNKNLELSLDSIRTISMQIQSRLREKFGGQK